MYLFTVVKCVVSLVKIIHAVYQRHIFKNMIWSEFENWICVFLIYLNNLHWVTFFGHIMWVFKVMLSYPHEVIGESVSIIFSIHLPALLWQKLKCSVQFLKISFRVSVSICFYVSSTFVVILTIPKNLYFDFVLIIETIRAIWNHQFY